MTTYWQTIPPHDTWRLNHGSIPLDKIIRTPEVMEVTGLSKTTIWRRVRGGDFLAPVKLGGPASRSVSWKKAEIEDWIDSRPVVDN